MSLKSFDDFCAKMVNNEPIQQKEIFDERQKITRQQITLHAVIVFACLSVVNTILMDCGGKWSEMYFAPMTWFYMISYIYWLIVNSIKGSLVGIEGTKYLKRNGGMMIFIAIWDFIPVAFNDEDKFEILSSGVLSNEFMMAVFLVMALASGIVSLLLVRYYNKKQDEEK